MNKQFSNSAIQLDYNKKNLFKIGALVYLVLIILALLFYKERTCFVDISFHLFYILKDGYFAIQNFRFGAFFTQLFPLIGSKMGFDLAGIAQLYSVGFVLYYFFLFVIILKVIKDKSIALVLLLFNTVFVTHGFFWIQSELPQGIAFTLTYFAIIHVFAHYEKMPLWGFAAIAPMLMAVAFFNPLLVFVVTFLTAFLMIHDRSRFRYYAMFWIAYIVIYLFKSLFFKTTYDDNANALWSNLVAYFPNYLTLPSQVAFIRYMVYDYYVLTLMLCWVVYYYYRTSAYLKMGLTLISFWGFAFIVNLNFPSDTVQFYIENQYLPLSIFVIVPFVFDVMPGRLNQTSVTVVITCIAVLAVGRFINVSEIYSERVESMRTVLHRTTDLTPNKLVLSQDQLPLDVLFMTWASPYEFWLLSTIEKGTSRSIVVADSPGSLDWTISRRDAFVTNWGVFNYTDLDPRYFKFNDDSEYGKTQLNFK